MKERPILFSASMVRALLAGTKTQTRRVATFVPLETGMNLSFRWLEPTEIVPGVWTLVSIDAGGAENEWTKPLRCPFGVPGDRLWVRENWQAWGEFDGMRAAAISAEARANINYPADGNTWVSRQRPSIHMPRWASRITLEITGVRVERLWDISETDAAAEGVTPFGDGGYHVEEGRFYMGTATQSYMALWEFINGPDSWDANPWVWVVEFHRVTI